MAESTHRRGAADRKPYAVDLVTLTTEDGMLLDGALYVPKERGPSDAALLIIHGKAGNFYTCVNRFLPPRFAELGYASLSMNMRCHDLGYNRADLPSSGSAAGAFRMAGGAWEQLDLGHLDLKAGAAHLRRLGFERIVLCGHSSGGFYAVDYVSRYRDMAALVLLSPLTTNKTPLRIWFPTAAELAAARRQAETLVVQGRGHELIPLRTWYHAISAASLLDRLGERQGWFDEALAAVDVPTLWLYGSSEDRVDLWRRYYETMRNDQKRLSIIAGSEHQYLGHEEAVFAAVAQFLKEVGIR